MDADFIMYTIIYSIKKISYTFVREAQSFIAYNKNMLSDLHVVLSNQQTNL